MTKGICRNCGFNFEVDNWKADYYTCPNCGKIHSLEEMYFCVKRPAQDLFADQSVQLARFRVDNKKLEDEKHELTRKLNNQQTELNQADAIIKRVRGERDKADQEYGEVARERDSANHACCELRSSLKEAEHKADESFWFAHIKEAQEKTDAALKRAAEYEHLTHVACEDLRLMRVSRDNSNLSLSICRQERDQAVDKLADAERRADEAFWYSKYEAANKSIIAAEKRTTEAGREIDHLRGQRSLLNQRLEELEEKGDDSFYDRKDEVMESFAEMLNTILVERDEKIKGLREENRQLFAGLTGAKHNVQAIMNAGWQPPIPFVEEAMKEIQKALDGEV